MFHVPAGWLIGSKPLPPRNLEDREPRNLKEKMLKVYNLDLVFS